MIQRTVVSRAFLGLCVGILCLLPACGGRRQWAPESLTPSCAQYVGELDGVKVLVRKLTPQESRRLFDGRGGYLFKRSRARSKPELQPLLVQITNNGINPVQLSRNGFSIVTLGADEVYTAVRKEPAARGCGWGIPLFLLLPIAGWFIGPSVGVCVGLAATSENKDIEAEIKSCLLDEAVNVLPGQTAKVIVAGAMTASEEFQLAIPDVGTQAIARSFTVDICESRIAWT